jgi:hypothetical protein
MAKRKSEQSLDDDEPAEKKAKLENKKKNDNVTVKYKDEKEEVSLAQLRFLCRAPRLSTDGPGEPLEPGGTFEIDSKTIRLGDATLEAFAALVKDPFGGAAVKQFRNNIHLRVNLCLLLDHLDAWPGLSETVLHSNDNKDVLPATIDSAIGAWVTMAFRFANAKTSEINHRLELYATCIAVLVISYRQKDNDGIPRGKTPPEGLTPEISWDMNRAMHIPRRPDKNRGWNLHVDKIMEMMILGASIPVKKGD